MSTQIRVLSALLFVLAAATTGLCQKEDDLKKLEASVTAKESTYAKTIRDVETADLIKTYTAYIEALDKEIKKPDIKPEDKARYEKKKAEYTAKLQLLRDSLGAGAQSGNQTGGGQPPKPKETEATLITFDPHDALKPGDSISVTGTITGADGAVVKDVKADDIQWTIGDAKPSPTPALDKSTKDAELPAVVGKTTVDKDTGKVTVEIFGKNKAGFPELLLLTAKAGGRPLGYTLIATIVPEADRGAQKFVATGHLYDYDDAKDLFGKTVAKHYHCVRISSEHAVDDDFQVTSITFTGGLTPVDFQEVIDRQEQRKILSGRNLLPLIAGALSTVMSGFTPFFINIAHQNQYHKFLNLLAIPSKDAVNLYWPDRIGDHTKVIDHFAFKHDKIVPKDSRLHGVVFVPKDKNQPNPDFHAVDVNGFILRKTTANPIKLN